MGHISNIWRESFKFISAFNEGVALKMEPKWGLRLGYRLPCKSLFKKKHEASVQRSGERVLELIGIAFSAPVPLG
jgi:hypothetical protein